MVELAELRLIGLMLGTKTSNKNGQSAIDCGKLWQKFAEGRYTEKIPEKASNDVFAVYFNYEGDYTKPFSYFIGCKVSEKAKVPDGMDSLIIPGGKYRIIKAKGKLPDCISKAWGVIWSVIYTRAYKTDFEIYGDRSMNWEDAEVEIFLSVN